MTDSSLVAPTTPTAPSLLGEGPARIPTGGKLRAGIKVLSKEATKNPQAQAIYDEGVAAGRAFDDIGRAITAAVPALTAPLIPRNVAWFTVRAQDFANPETARQILAAYGEDRGEGRRLYRFPVVFPADHWQSIMPHELAAWGAHEKRYWSQYSPDGRARHCLTHAPVPIDESGRRAIRLFGGRKTMMRERNGGVCEPEACPEYQARECNLTGRFLFFIPGIASISAFELPTNSFYALNAARQKFETIAFLRGGRISGFLDRSRTPFYFTKQLLEVPHIDETGRAVRVPQWIIVLEAPVDVTALLREREDDEAILAEARRASRVLQGEGDAASGPAPVSPPGTGSGPAAASERPSRDGPPALVLVLERAQAYGLAAARYQAYAERRWGPGWKLHPQGRERAWAELERYANDPAGYVDKIESELQGAARERRA